MAKILILGTGLSRSKKPGMAIPAVVLFRQLCLLDVGNDVQIIGLDKIADVKKNELNIRSSEIVIINSLSTLLHDGSDLLLKLLISKKIFLYLHETEYVLEYSEKTSPQKMSAFWRALPHMGLLCSTRQQQDFYRKLGLVNTAVIYNSLNLNPAYGWRRERILGDEIRVVMIGSIQRRKGSAFFDQVANLLTQSDQRYKFTWIGGRTDREDGDYEFSGCVEWVQHISSEDIYSVFAQTDVFFLSSIDDPLPLSATEAAAAGLRVVAFEGTGTHETLSGNPGYVSFSTYSPEHAAEAIKKSVSIFPKNTDYSKVAPLFSSQSFANKAWREISMLIDKIPTFDWDAEHASEVRKMAGSEMDVVSPLLIAYGLPALLPNDVTSWLSQVKQSLDLNKARALVDEYSEQTRELYGFEVLGVAKLLLICESYKRCLEFLLPRIHSGVPVNSSVAITLAALNGLQKKGAEGDFLTSWVMPRILGRIRVESHKSFLYEYAAKVMMELGYSLLAERYAKRANDLSPAIRVN